MALIIKKRNCDTDKKNGNLNKINPDEIKGRIKIGSIVFFRSRKWKYVGNKKDKCKLVLCENETPVKFMNGYTTETSTSMKNLTLIQSA